MIDSFRTHSSSFALHELTTKKMPIAYSGRSTFLGAPEPHFRICVVAIRGEAG
jgi:hypothetical protein